MSKNINYLSVFSSIFFLLMTSSLTTPAASTSPNEFVFKRGTNISHWLSQSDARGIDRKNFFTEKDVKYLAGLGFDHIRIPVDEEQLWKEDGQQDAEAFSLLKQALDWCKRSEERRVG